MGDALNSEDERLCIMTLPEEIRGLIFNKLPQSEILNIRLVCRQWNLDVDNYFDFDVKKLDEKSPYFHKILQLRIKNLQIFRLTETSVLNPDGSLIFKHSNLIRGINILNQGIADYIYGSGRIPYVSSQNVQLLIQQFARSLHRLSMDLYPSVCIHQFPQTELSYSLDNLTRLEINLQGIFKIEDHSNYLLQVLENSPMPKLVALKVTSPCGRFCEDTNTRVILNIFRLIIKNGKHLQSLYIDLGRGSDINPQLLPLSEKEVEELTKITRLTDVCLNVKPFGLMTPDFWRNFLSSQNNLKHIKICKRPPVSPVPFLLFRNIVVNNSSTLVSICIHTLNLTRNDPPLDLSIFRNCFNLKSLEMERIRNDVTVIIPDRPDVYNFNLLPDSIIKLWLDDFKILSDELKCTFNETMTKLEKLEELTLYKCGCEGNYGVNGSVLNRIIKRQRRRLMDIYIYKGFNNKDLMEQIKLNEIIFRYGHVDVNSVGFGLKRRTAEDQWTPYHRRNLF